ncbi:radical SAM protein [Methanobrevibacter sp. AbM4]|uniref:SPL family radical SAM protein n=1 Tax=Methanobrevibacter sp. AbM4 TaxID=224719 RepID=UPI0003348E99|nr:radical SAM protein [Methanobrevibacter sp. AbM4]AGN17293.1 radical SAM domain-containing protein [Methanobrevibacter sp. AbM4]
MKKYGFKSREVKSIFTKRNNERKLFLEDFTINPYLGCSFNCSYCYINGSKYAGSTDSYYVKSNAIELTKSELKKLVKNNKKGFVCFGSATDPYQDIESELYLTRDLLKLVNRFHFPVHILTKSDLVLRDTDILKKINQPSTNLPDDLDLDTKVYVSFSFSTLDENQRKIFESSAPSIKRRLDAIKILKNNDFKVGVSFMPILPFIADSNNELNKTMAIFSDIGIDYIVPGSMSLFGNGLNDSRVKYFNLIKRYYPEHYEDTKDLFFNKKTSKYNNYPPTSYQNNLLRRISKIAEEYNIKTSMFS